MNPNRRQSIFQRQGQLIANISPNSNPPPQSSSYINHYVNHRIKNGGFQVSQGKGHHWCTLASCITAMKILGKATIKTTQQGSIDITKGLLSDGTNLIYVNYLFSLLGRKFDLKNPDQLNQMYLAQLSLNDISQLFPNFCLNSINSLTSVQSLVNISKTTPGIVMLKFRNPPSHFHMCLIDHIYATANNMEYRIWVYNPSKEGIYHRLNINNIVDLKCNDKIENLSLHTESGWEFISAYIIT